MDSGPAFSKSSAVRLLSFLEKQSQSTSTSEESTMVRQKSEESNDTIPITKLERIIRAHPIWFLPEKNRMDGERMLRGKEEGTFLIRKSSKKRTLALTIRQGTLVEHYLIHQIPESKRLKLEISDRTFDNILSLVYHYMTVKEDFPILLKLPHLLMITHSRSNLTSMALLGKDFWNYPMSFPPLEELSSHSSFDSKKGKSFKSNLSLPQLLDDALSGLQDITDLLQYSFMEPHPNRRLSHHQKPISPVIQLPKRNSHISRSPSDYPSISSSYNRSSITDKISDYEDIWEDKDLTLSQSEKKFKQYLHRKLKMSSASPISEDKIIQLSPSYDEDDKVLNHEDYEEEDTEESSSCLRSLISSNIFTSSSIICDSASSKDIIDICLTDFDVESMEDKEKELYSDPLDALENAVDTEVYDSIDPDSSRSSSSEPNTLTIEEANSMKQAFGTHETEVNNNEVLSSSKDNYPLRRNSITHFKRVQKSSSAENINVKPRKISCGPVMQPSRKKSLPKLVQETRRFSLIINKYIQRTASNKEFASFHEGQVDSSSWEYLFEEEEQEEAEEESERNPMNHSNKSKGSSSNDGSLNSSKNNNTSSTTTTTSSQLNKEELCLRNYDTYIDIDKEEIHASQKIQNYINSLYANESSTFGTLVKQFILCTCESKEVESRILLRNVRQFLNGIRNYLVGSGEGSLKSIIQNERKKLKSNECMNLNSIYEEVLYDIVLKPLYGKLLSVLGNHVLDDKALQKDELKIHKITFKYFLKINSEFSPSKKIGHLLSALQFIQRMLKGKDGDETLDTRLKSYVSQFLNRYNCQDWFRSQMEYVLCLLPQYCLDGESRRYLSIVSSSVAFRSRVKTSLFRQSCIFGKFESKWDMENSDDSLDLSSSMVTVLIPNENDGSLLRSKLNLNKTVSKTDLIKMIQEEKNLKDSQEFDLSCLSEEGEQALNVFYEFNQDCLQKDQTVLVYKRKDISFLLPPLKQLNS
ncbi:uncharacterized protein spri [Lepeophtheirus salmonis]|uniref:uncharacterized protein spri n=1 Tax=Lepeophtheirus salmonis TaxID=72036 RepID=UPI001AE2F3B5|nr:protein sprint-like [Lepeophtheirus salmonis]